jgi:hypothetical protein
MKIGNRMDEAEATNRGQEIMPFRSNLTAIGEGLLDRFRLGARCRRRKQAGITHVKANSPEQNQPRSPRDGEGSKFWVLRHRLE